MGVKQAGDEIDCYAQSIMGATLKRRDGSGVGFTGLKLGFWTILLNVFSACFWAFSGVFQVSVVRNTTSKPTRTTSDMAAIRARELADGSVSYTAQIRLKRDGVQVYQESQTFVRKQGRTLELKLGNFFAMEKAQEGRAADGKMIGGYLGEY